uniref:CSON011249 protein n=1 Tax=Culicoides sonorensis TaxID=179676 RepID=A0A336M5S8_CULSO
MENSCKNRSLSPQTSSILNNYKEIIKKLEKNVGSYTEKLELLEKGWISGEWLIEKSSRDALENILAKLLKQTWPIVLLGEWYDVPSEKKSELKQFIQKTINFAVEETPMVLNCKYLLNIFDDPWTIPGLSKILKAHPNLTLDEEKQFHYNEIGPIMTVRLQKLCDTDLEELALNYSNSCLRCIPSSSSDKILNETRILVSDINLALLSSLGKTNEFISKIESWDFDTGFSFVKRYSPKQPFNGSAEIKQLLVNAAAHVASILLTKAVKSPIKNKENCVTYLNILGNWLNLHKHEREFNELVHEILSLAISSQHLYYCAKIIEKGIGDHGRYLAIEVQIRGITQDLNEIEMNKYDGEVTAETVLKLESNLATPYVRLAEMFSDNEHVKRECYLTAFSLRPQKEIFDQVRNNRIIRPDENESMKSRDKISIECKHEVVNETSSVSKVYCKYCGKYRNADDEELTKSCEILLNSETLSNVPQKFHSDLIIIVESPRIKQLSWSMPWYELEMNCQKLMDEEQRLQLTSNQLVNANDQLQFIDLDYSMYRHLPEAEVPGIEKGYEQYLVSSDESEENEIPLKQINVKQESGTQGYSQFFESDDDSDASSEEYTSRRKRVPKRKSGGENKKKPAFRLGRWSRVYIDKTKSNVPPKKRIHQHAKKKFEFDYNGAHARFYIVCRKAQLDIKRQRLRLLQKRNCKYFYNFLEEAKIKKPVSLELAKKHTERLQQLTRFRTPRKKSMQNDEEKKGKRDDKPSSGHNLLFSSGVVARVAGNGCIVAPKQEKAPRPKSIALENVENKPVNIPSSEVLENGPKDGLIKKKRMPRQPKPKLGPDGEPLVPSLLKKPRVAANGEVSIPKPKPIRKPRAKKSDILPPNPEQIPEPVLDASKYEAAEILAQLGSVTNGIDPAALMNHQQLDGQMPCAIQSNHAILKSILTEQNGDREIVNLNNSAVELTPTKLERRGRPKGVKNKPKYDADGNLIPKPLRKSKSNSSDASIRTSVSSNLSQIEIKEEIPEPLRESVIKVVPKLEDNPFNLYDKPVINLPNDVEMTPKIISSIDLTEAEPEIIQKPEYNLVTTVKTEKISDDVHTQTIIDDEGIPIEIIKKTSKKRKINGDLVVGPNGEVMEVKKEISSTANGAKKLVVEGLDGVKKTIDATDKRELALAKRREYSARYRNKKRLEAEQSASTSNPPLNQQKTRVKASKPKTQEKSLPPALMSSDRHSPSMLEVNVPSLPIDSDGKIIPTPSITAENSIDFETLIKCDNLLINRNLIKVQQNGRRSSAAPGSSNRKISNGIPKRITRSKTIDSRSNSPLPNTSNNNNTKNNNLPSHLIQTVNYSFTSHRYNDSGGNGGGLKRKFGNFINYTAGCWPSKTDKLSFNELRSIKDALNESWTDAERVELEQMMSRYFYDVHPISKVKKESQIFEKRNYLKDSGLSDTKNESHTEKNLSKILIRQDYLNKNNAAAEPEIKQEDEFFRDERLVKGAESGRIEFYLNDFLKNGQINENSNKNDKKNYKNRFCKLFKGFERPKIDDSKDKCKEFDEKSDDDVKNYLIATVPGMTDFEFFEMPEQERFSIVEIVHTKSQDSKKETKNDESNTSNASAGSSTVVVTSQSSSNDIKKAPTQVTAHIQRIGHPIQISSGSAIKATTSSEPNNRPKYLLQRTISSQPSVSTSNQVKNQTLINVLSHQVLVPGKNNNSNNTKITVTNGTGVTLTSSGSSMPSNVILNNFKSTPQTPTKIVKSFSQNWTLSPSITTNAGSGPGTLTVSSSQANSQHLLQILNSPPNTRKNLTITTAQVNNKDEANPSQGQGKAGQSANGVVQFICKTDGKMIHLTPINNAVIQQGNTPEGQNIILNSLLKKKDDDAANQDEESTAPRSVYEENYANFIRTGPKTQGQLGQKPIQVVVSGAGGSQILQQIVSGANPGTNQLILQNNKLVATSSLPKFNQVFGKTVTMYQPGTNSVQEIKSPDRKNEKKHIIVQTSSASGTTQNILIHNKSGRAQILQTTKNEGLKLVTSQAQTTPNESPSTMVTPLRISVPLMPRSQQSMIGSTRIVRPIIQLAPNMIKTEQGQNVIVATSQGIRQKLGQGQNIRLENLLLAAQSQGTATSTTTATSTNSGGSKNVDNSTLEQLREFDMVLEQVKERSTSVPSSPQSGPGQSPVRPNQVTVINHVKTSVASSSSQTQRVQEIIYTTAQGASVLQKVNFAFLQQSGGQSANATIKSQNPSLGTPLVVVTNYNQHPTVVSPALSVTSQLSSPTRSVKSLNTKQSTVTIPVKPKTMHSPDSASSSSKTLTPKSSPLPKPIQKPQEDEQTVQRIYDILAEYAEQLRNSPDLNNKPAPRRRSNPPTNPATPSTKKKKSGKKYQGGSDVNSDYEGNFESEDSSLGPGSVSGIPSTPSLNNFSPSEPDITLMDDQSDASTDRFTPKQSQSTQQERSGDGKSAEKSSVAKQLVFSDALGSLTQNNISNAKGVVIKESALNEVIAQAGKLGNNAAVLMPGNYLLPVNLLKSGRQIAILTSANGSKILAALPGTSSNNAQGQMGSPIKEQMTLQELKRLGSDGTGKNSTSTATKNESSQVLCLRTLSNNSSQLILSPNSSGGGSTQKSTETNKSETQNASPSNAGTAIIISSPKGKKRYLINDPELIAKLTKGGELSTADVKKLIELQSTEATNNVVATSMSNSVAGSSSQGFSSQNQSHKGFQLHKHINSNGDLSNSSEIETEHRHNNDTAASQLASQYQGKIILSDRRIVEAIGRNSHNQQAALERELRLQKSLSEECEDLGVDEPEDLFPEAGLLFDSLDPSSQEHGMGIDTPKGDKLTPIFFAEERKKNSPAPIQIKQEDSKTQNDMKIESPENLGSITFNEDSNLGASTEVKTEEVKSKDDLYEFNTDEKSSDENTDTEYNRFLHKKLGRLSQPPMFSYKRKRSLNSTGLSPKTKKEKAMPQKDAENDEITTILDHHSTDADAGSTADEEDIEDVISTNVVQSVGTTLVVSTEKSRHSPHHTRRASTRGHVKKNCPCCKTPKKNSNHIHTHQQIISPEPKRPSPSPVMTRKLRASIGSPSGSSTHSSSSPSTSSSLGGGTNHSDVNANSSATHPEKGARARRSATINNSNKQATSKLSKRR